MIGSKRNWTGLLVMLTGAAMTNSLTPSSAVAETSPTSVAEVSQNEKPLVPAGLLQLPTNSHYYSPYAFVVDKKARMLSVWQQTTNGLKLVSQFPADLGRSSGEKRNRGDFKTPEGIYFLQERKEGASLDFRLYGKRAFTTDYPNFFDRIEGKTGDGIWLHAVPDEVPLTRGSKGCVVVRNNVILDLTQYIRLGRTPILIQNNAALLSLEDLGHHTTELAQWIENWRNAWETKNIDGYISHYGNDFRALKMNREQWREHKTRLADQYKSISVRLSKPAIFTDRDRTVVRFLQEYTSDQHSDFGEKVLYLKKNKDGYQIIGETWAEESSQVAREEIESTTNATTANCQEGSVGCVRNNASAN